MPEPLVVLNPPPQTCLPNSPEALLEFVAQYLGVQFPTGYTQIVISDSTPAPADQSKIWLKVDGSGNPIGFFLYAGGAWVPIAPPNVFFASDTGSSNALSIVLPNYPYTTQHPGLFIVKAAATNTGASTITVTSPAFAAVPIKIANVDPYAAAIIVGHYYIFSYTGTTFELLNPSDAVQSPTLVAQYVYQAASGTAAAAIPSGDTTIPLNTTLPNSASFGTLGGSAVALGAGTYLITGGVHLVDNGGTPGASLQLSIMNSAAYINWQDALINNADDTSFVQVQAVWVVPTGGSASISLRLSLSSGNLIYGADVTSARAERIASLTILKLA